MNPLLFLLYIALGILWLVAWAQIFKKAGHSAAMCILMLIPVINFIVFLVFAFSRWPIRDNLPEENSRNSLPF